jgi:hypothetical protein
VVSVPPKTALVLAGVVGVIALAWYAKRQAGAAVAAVAPLVNPFDDRNFANQAAESIYQAITGSENSIGSDVYEVTHNGTLDPTSANNVIYRNLDPRTQDAWGKIVYGGVQFAKGDGTLNPTSSNNIIYRNIAGGDLGGRIYDWFH